MIDLYKLQIFNVVAQEGSFSAAAERLYMTQSAVSQHVKDLEAGLGRPLFVRGRRGVKLTPYGETLLGYARDIFDLVARAELALTDVENLSGGRVTLGATPGIAVYLAPGWLQRFRERYPRLTAAVQTGITPQIVAGVLAGRLDLGLIEGELEGYRRARPAWRELAEIEQLIVVGPGHPWWNRDEVQPAELHGQPFIMRPPDSQTRIWLDEALRALGVQPVVVAEFDNLESIKWTVANGACLTVLPDYVVGRETADGTLRALPVVGRPLRRTLKLVYAEDGHFSPPARAFLAELAGEFEAVRELLVD